MSKYVNAKAEAGKAKKKEAEDAKNAVKAKQAVGSNARSNAKSAAAADKEAEKVRREAEKAALLAAEDQDLADANAKAKKKSAKKSKDDQLGALLSAGLANDPAKKKKQQQAAEASAKKVTEEKARSAAAAKGIVFDEKVAKLEANVNHLSMGDGESASGIDNALEMLGAKKPAAGKVGNYNRKALYSAFEEKTMATLKLEFPGLKMSQYKERCFAAWQRSPENPENMPK